MLRVFAEYQPFPFPLAPGEKIQPNCWQILLMSAVFAIFVYPLFFVKENFQPPHYVNKKLQKKHTLSINFVLYLRKK